VADGGDQRHGDGRGTNIIFRKEIAAAATAKTKRLVLVEDEARSAWMMSTITVTETSWVDAIA
jgi:hypothetical protein